MATPDNRNLFFTPTSSSTPQSTDSQPPSTYLYPKREKPQRRFVDKEDLNTPVIPPVYSGQGSVPHFSMLDEDASLTNPITGKSVYFGLYPWRCSDRLTDWYQSLISLDGPSTQLHHFRTTRACSSSALGDEPLDPYIRLPKSTALYFKERADAGMMRMRFWEQYPFDLTDVKTIGETDAVRMRTWRQQRHLEEVAKADTVEDLIRSSVLSSNKGFVEKATEESKPVRSK